MSSLQEHQQVLLELLCEFDRICKKLNINYMLFAGSALGAVRHNGFIPWDDDLDILMLRAEYDKFLLQAPDLLDEKYMVQKEYSEHWPMFFSKLRKNNTTCLEKYHPKDPLIHQGIYIDIFPCDNLSDNSFMRKLQFYSSKVVIAKCLKKREYETDSKKKKLFMALTSLLPFKLFLKITLMKKHTSTKRVHSFLGGASRYDKSNFPREWIAETENVTFESSDYPVSAHYDKLLTTLYGDYMTIPKEEDRKCKVHAILVDTEKPYTDYLHYRDNMIFDEYTRSIR